MLLSGCVSNRMVLLYLHLVDRSRTHQVPAISLNQITMTGLEDQ